GLPLRRHGDSIGGCEKGNARNGTPLSLPLLVEFTFLFSHRQRDLALFLAHPSPKEPAALALMLHPRPKANRVQTVNICRRNTPNSYAFFLLGEVVIRSFTPGLAGL